MSEAGYRRYQRFFEAPPQVCVEWHDDQTEAVGWLVMNSLTGNAAGGGTRMRSGGTREEAVFLAKTMEIKFRVCGPPIGGAKTVIDFDPERPEKEGVLRRYYRAIAPYLRQVYGTAGDQNVDEITEVIPLTREIGVHHPQEGVVRGHFGADDEAIHRVIDNLNRGVEMPVAVEGFEGKTLSVADLITGYGVAHAIGAYYDAIGQSVEGKRVLVEGFGNVGGPAALYLDRLGAKIVGVVARGGGAGSYHWSVSDDGVDVADLLKRRNRNDLPDDCQSGSEADGFWNTRADLFLPAATSRTITGEVLDRLESLGVETIACGANAPFAESEPGLIEIQCNADRRFTILPDFLCNGGIARCFAYLMADGVEVTPEAIFADTQRTIREGIKNAIAVGGGGPGLLGRSFEHFLP